MSSETLRSRIAHLLRKSQKAVYLYSHGVSESSSTTVSSTPVSSSPVSSSTFSSFGGWSSPVASLGRGRHKNSRENARRNDSAGGNNKRYSHLPVLVWKRVNEELSVSLRLLLRVQPRREFSLRALSMRDDLYEKWRRFEAELHRDLGELTRAVEKEQFVKATLLSERLITLKAQVQATRAAFNELESAIGDIRGGSGEGVNDVRDVFEEDAVDEDAVDEDAVDEDAVDEDIAEENPSKILLFRDRRSARS